jgi:hypothetical protein
MGPERASQESTDRQGTASSGVGRGGRRLCLLKGCERPFSSRRPLARYCSERCRRQARRWRRWKARQRYRRSDRGRELRQEQSRRRRERLKRSGDRDAVSCPCVGDPELFPSGFSSCDRPGCYECFPPSARSPLKRFCSANCQRALRRVELREARHRCRSAVAVSGRGEGSFRTR